MLYVQTRSACKDYNFFTPDEVKRWWSSEEYGNFFKRSFNICAEIYKDTFRVYIGRIPCGRRDEAGTTITYAFAGDGNRGDKDALFLYHTLLYLLSDYTDQQNFDSRLKKFGVSLDKCFGEGYFNSIDNNRYTKETEQYITARLEKLGEILKKETVQKEVPDFTLRNTAKRIEKDTILQGISLIRRITGKSLTGKSLTDKSLTGKTSDPALLVITSMPLDKDEVTKCMCKYWEINPDADTLWLSSYQNSEEFSVSEGFPVKKTKAEESDTRSSVVKPVIAASIGVVLTIILIWLFQENTALKKDVKDLGIKTESLEETVEVLKRKTVNLEETVKVLKDENAELKARIEGLENEKTKPETAQK